MPSFCGISGRACCGPDEPRRRRQLTLSWRQATFGLADLETFFPFQRWFPVMSRSNQKRDCTVAEGARPSIVPAGTPNWVPTPELVEQTIRVGQPYYQAILTPEEAVIMILSVGRLYQALSSESSP